MQFDLFAKILVIGDSGVGKTALAYRFTEDKFPLFFTATMGVDFTSKTIEYNNKKIRMHIADTAGQQRFKTVPQAICKRAQGILLTFSLIDADSFKNIELWAANLDPNPYKILVGTKADCQADRAVSKQDAELLAIKLGMKYIQTSSKSNCNVNETFQLLAKSILESFQNKPKEPTNADWRQMCSLI